MESYCRACVREFDTTDLLQYSESKRRLFVYCTGLQVKRNDTFTFQLCKECFFNLKFACKFKKQCRSSDKKFKTYIGLKNAGETVDFSTYLKNGEENFSIKIPHSTKDTGRMYQKCYDDDDENDDNESTCTSIQNFMTDIRESLQVEDILTTEDKIIREVIQEEADISDDSLDSHWLQDDEFGMDLNFAEFGTPPSTNENRCTTPQCLSNDEDDTCHYIHKDVMLKSDKTIISSDKNTRTDQNADKIRKPNSISNQDIALLDDCAMSLDGIISTNVPMTEIETEFEMINANKESNEQQKTQQLVVKEVTDSSFNELEFYSNKEKYNQITSEKFVQDNVNKLQFEHDIAGNGDIPKTYVLNVVKTDVANELQQYIDKELEKKISIPGETQFEEKCSIDKNLELALQNTTEETIPLEKLLESPQDEGLGGTTPIVNKILFGDLTPVHSNIGTDIKILPAPEINLEVSQAPNFIIRKDLKKLKKLKRHAESPEDKKLGDESHINSKVGIKNIKKMKRLLNDENANDSFEFSDETSIDESIDTDESDDEMSEDGEPYENEMYVKTMQNSEVEDLDISMSKLLEFDGQSVDLNISIASGFLEENNEQIIYVNQNDKGGLDQQLISVADIKVIDPELYKDSMQINAENGTAKEENGFKLPLPPPDDKYDLEIGYCKICERNFKNSRALKLHFVRVHKQLLPKTERKITDPKMCPTCGKVIKDPSAFARHLKTHTDPVQCAYCSQTFPTVGRLNMHMRSHADLMTAKEWDAISRNKNKDQTYVCSTCGRSFTLLSSYRSHVKRHTGTYTMKCEYCDKGFFRLYDLQQHMDKHTKENRFACEYCPKKYRSRYMLTGHIYRHLGIRKFVCPHCDRQFETRQILIVHLRTCKRAKDVGKKTEQNNSDANDEIDKNHNEDIGTNQQDIAEKDMEQPVNEQQDKDQPVIEELRNEQLVLEELRTEQQGTEVIGLQPEVKELSTEQPVIEELGIEQPDIEKKHSKQPDVAENTENSVVKDNSAEANEKAADQPVFELLGTEEVSIHEK